MCKVRLCVTITIVQITRRNAYFHVSRFVQNPLVHVVVHFERILKVIQQSFQFALLGNVVADLVLDHEHQSGVQLLDLRI